MRGAQASGFRDYWMRYIVAFWTGEALRWVRDNILLACLCSIAPGVIAAGLGAALSDDKWRTATYATLLTYAGLFVLFLTWRLALTPVELDQKRHEVITGLSKSLTCTRSKLAALRARPPAIDAEILEIYLQAEAMQVSRTSHLPIDGHIFMRAKLRLREIRAIEVLKYELSAVLHGNSIHADFLDDIPNWGRVTQRKPIGIGTTFCYIVNRLTPLVRKLDQPGVPVEGWLHFPFKGMHEREIEATMFRLSVVTPTGAVSAEIRGDETLDRIESRQFQKLPIASCVK